MNQYFYQNPYSGSGAYYGGNSLFSNPYSNNQMGFGNSFNSGFGGFNPFSFFGGFGGFSPYGGQSMFNNPYMFSPYMFGQNQTKSNYNQQQTQQARPGIDPETNQPYPGVNIYSGAGMPTTVSDLVFNEPKPASFGKTEPTDVQKVSMTKFSPTTTNTKNNTGLLR